MLPLNLAIKAGETVLYISPKSSWRVAITDSKHLAAALRTCHIFFYSHKYLKPPFNSIQNECLRKPESPYFKLNLSDSDFESIYFIGGNIYHFCIAVVLS